MAGDFYHPPSPCSFVHLQPAPSFFPRPKPFTPIKMSIKEKSKAFFSHCNRQPRELPSLPSIPLLSPAYPPLTNIEFHPSSTCPPQGNLCQQPPPTDFNTGSAKDLVRVDEGQNKHGLLWTKSAITTSNLDAAGPLKPEIANSTVLSVNMVELAMTVDLSSGMFPETMKLLPSASLQPGLLYGSLTEAMFGVLTKPLHMLFTEPLFGKVVWACPLAEWSFVSVDPYMDGPTGCWLITLGVLVMVRPPPWPPPPPPLLLTSFAPGLVFLLQDISGKLFCLPWVLSPHVAQLQSLRDLVFCPPTDGLYLDRSLVALNAWGCLSLNGSGKGIYGWRGWFSLI